MTQAGDSECSPVASASGSRVAYAAVLAAVLCCYAALGAVLSILPRYVPDQLGGGPTAVGLAVGAPALTRLLARALGGRLADRLGARSPPEGECASRRRPVLVSADPLL